jgi:hypothetical protein
MNFFTRRAIELMVLGLATSRRTATRRTPMTNPAVSRVSRVNRLLTFAESDLLWRHPEEAEHPHVMDSEGTDSAPLPPGVVAAVDALPDDKVAPFIQDLFLLLVREGEKAFNSGLALGKQRQRKEFHDLIGITAIRDAIKDGLNEISAAIAEHR